MDIRVTRRDILRSLAAASMLLALSPVLGPILNAMHTTYSLEKLQENEIIMKILRIEERHIDSSTIIIVWSNVRYKQEIGPIMYYDIVTIILRERTTEIIPPTLTIVYSSDNYTALFAFADSEEWIYYKMRGRLDISHVFHKLIEVAASKQMFRLKRILDIMKKSVAS